MQKICDLVQAEHFKVHHQHITLSSSVLDRLDKGGMPKSKSNAAKGWLLPEEAETVIQYAVEVASCGFPLTHRRLKECVDEICRARMGDAFPEAGVGIQWTQRFCEKHSDRLDTYWTAPLDNKRGRAVNPTTNAQWFDLLEATMAGKLDKEFDIPVSGEPPATVDITMEIDDDQPEVFVPILDENTYGTDESGFFAAGSVRERVIAGTGKQWQYQQADGGRENTTVIVTIRADGSALRP
ncbi:hypothetical protein DFH07DRAFT_711119, partial [Mycena maculata]